MQTAAQSSGVHAEDLARAHCYALISRLFYAPPDADLLNALALEPQTEAPDAAGVIRHADEALPNDYATAFRTLKEASRTADPTALRQEYDDLFVGAGKALVTPYTSGYSLPHAPDRHLLTLRERLTALGLARRESTFELEDHVSAVCDVMRWLIERGSSVDEQLRFFEDYVYSGVGAFCDAIEASRASAFYSAVARFARVFLAVDNQAFDLHSAE
jgi:TorA maturation chaperone TorD